MYPKIRLQPKYVIEDFPMYTSKREILTSSTHLILPGHVPMKCSYLSSSMSGMVRLLWSPSPLLLLLVHHPGSGQPATGQE